MYMVALQALLTPVFICFVGCCCVIAAASCGHGQRRKTPAQQHHVNSNRQVSMSTAVPV
jgi:hypothetical protein